jgi:FkbM family methyltransferase
MMHRDDVKRVLDRVGVLGITEKALRSVRSVTTESGRHQRRHRADMLPFYRELIGPGDLVFDVGAHLGGRTEIFLALGATVVAVEPQPDCVQRLHRHYGADTRVTIIDRALDRTPGERVMRGSAQSPMSSLSESWIKAVEASGRFASSEFAVERRVHTTTLDSLIAVFGLPRFCKIDVEGFELEVISGLSHPIPELSLEFTPETMDASVTAMQRLDAIAPYEFNFASGESMRFDFSQWLPREAFVEALDRLMPAQGRERFYGDLYARLRAR